VFHIKLKINFAALGLLTLTLIFTLSPVQASEYYIDIENNWAYDYIAAAIDNGWMNGYGDGTFRPDNNISVLETCTVLYRLIKENYPDSEVITDPDKIPDFLSENKILDKSDFLNYYRPITREETAKLALKAYGFTESAVTSNFDDDHLISMDKRGSVNRAREIGVIGGFDNKFNPLSPLSRAEFCVIISKIVKVSKTPDGGFSEPAAFEPTSRNIKIPVLLYHTLTLSEEDALNSEISVTPQKFEADLEYINSLGYTPVFARDLNKKLPPKPILITFDDGYKTNYDYVYPLAQKYNMKVTVFLNGWTGEMPGYEHKFTWEEAREMLDGSVIDIQSHSNYLHEVNSEGQSLVLMQAGENTAEYIERVAGDCASQNQKFMDNLGYAPTVFAYPYGQSDAASEAITGRYYFASFTTEETFFNPAYGLRKIPRFTVRQYTTLDFLDY
jgi:peptidoglycan/xylan/chitin deacetylase (PgdA/CDA1 family)